MHKISLGLLMILGMSATLFILILTVSYSPEVILLAIIGNIGYIAFMEYKMH